MDTASVNSEVEETVATFVEDENLVEMTAAGQATDFMSEDSEDEREEEESNHEVTFNQRNNSAAILEDGECSKSSSPMRENIMNSQKAMSRVSNTAETPK